MSVIAWLVWVGAACSIRDERRRRGVGRGRALVEGLLAPVVIGHALAIVVMRVIDGASAND